MNSLHKILWFLGLLLLQVVVFNHIQFMGYATPMPFFYLLLILPSDTARWAYVAVGFALGLAVDVLSNTLGECAATTTLMGLVTPHLLNAFAPADRDDEPFQPGVRTMKWTGFVKYGFSASVIFCTVFFLLETFSLMHFTRLLLYISSSTVLTFLLVIAIERLRKK